MSRPPKEEDMDANILDFLRRNEKPINTRHWKRLAQRLASEFGRDFTAEEAKQLGQKYQGQKNKKPKSPFAKVSIESTSPKERTVEVTGTRTPLRTLEDLLKAAQVDQEKWAVRSWTANTWTMGGKSNWQVKAFLERKIDREDFLQSLSAGQSSTRYVSPPLTEEGSLLVIPDCQIGLFWERGELQPYHDRRAMDTIWKVAESEQPGTIVIVGDFLDLAIWSTKFQREPKDRYTTKYALFEARWWLRRLRENCPKSRILFLEGNHEKRIQTVLIEYFQELSTLDLVDVETLLDLARLGIEYRGPYGSESTYFFGDKVIGYHGDVVRQGGGLTSAAVVKGQACSIFFGHTHRLGFSSRALHSPDGVRVISAMEVGCACRLDGAVPGNSRPDWAHGYGWVVCREGQVFQTPMQILDGVTLTPRGERIQGEDPTEEISRILKAFQFS